MSARHNPSSNHGQTINTNIENTGTDNTKRLNSSRIRADGRCVRDKETMAAEKLAEQATTLMKLKCICAFLIVSSAVTVTTFGALTNAIIKRIDRNEQHTGTIQSQINADRSLIHQHEEQLQKLKAQTDYINGSTLQGNNDLNILNATYYADRQLYIASQTNNLTLFDDFGERLKAVELNHTQNFLAINAHATQLNELQTNWTVSQHIVHELETQISQIQVNMSFKSLMLHSHHNDILLLNSSIRQIENHLSAQNGTINAEKEWLSQLKNETEDCRRIVDTHTLKLAQHEERLVSVNETLQEQIMRVLQIETVQRTNYDMIVNNSAKIADVISNQTLKLGLLERDIVTVKDNVRNQTDQIQEIRANADAQNVSLFINTFRLEDLENRQTLDELHTANQSVRIADLEFSRQSDLGRIVEMEQVANITQQTLYDLNVYLTNITETNVAYGKPAQQSSVFEHHPAEKAVDGCFNNDLNYNCCSHTMNDYGAWWRLDLGYTTAIREIRITRRWECDVCRERINGFELYVTNTVNTSTAVPVYTMQEPSSEQVLHIPLTETYGRFVTITVPGRNTYLELCEVEIIEDRKCCV